ncbi:MAG: hypothetical protein DRQ02_11225 [Candidatus Latescibacterota bacterium]|nr:MAG: hypothetical protein DRQ02_11225 [Candidatus Latescibacterota bacterium]
MWWKVIVVALVVLAFVITAAILYGTKRWQLDTRGLHTRIGAARVPITRKSYDPRELEGLPAPVQRYFQAVLKEGQPLIAAVSVEHTGTFNMSETGEQWKPFRSTQRVITQRPGFVWDARIRMAPGMTVHVYDAYVAGEGVLTAKLFGLLTVMKQSSTPELAQGELMRFFAEAAWYPTALLPSQGVVWEAIDDTQARATLTDGTTTAELVFQFDDQGLISSVRSDGRYREVDGALVATPWQGRLWNYELRDGKLIPLDGEVTWLLPEGPKPYWRGRIQRIEYEYAD